MSPEESSAYAACSFLISALALLHLILYNRIKKRAGLSYASWSRLFHLGFSENIVILGLVTILAVWSLSLIVRKPDNPEGYQRLLLLAFGLSFSPHHNVVIGSRGLVYRLRFIAWSDIRRLSYVSRKSRTLLCILYATSPRSNMIRSASIPLPRDFNPFKGQDPIGRNLVRGRGDDQRGVKATRGGEGGIRTHGPSLS